MTRVNFEQELEVLKISLEEMGRYVEYTIDKLIEAIDKQDKELAEFIIENDRSVNDMEKNIEAKCLSLITKQQPVARDLRRVSAALKVVTDIERIGDHAADIAELIIRNIHIEIPRYSMHLLPMTEVAKNMVHNAMETFLDRDAEKAKEVVQSDDIVDDLFNKTKSDVITSIRNGEENVDICVDILMISKYLEKIGDHAVNIAEWEIFQETGSINNVRLL